MKSSILIRQGMNLEHSHVIGCDVLKGSVDCSSVVESTWKWPGEVAEGHSLRMDLGDGLQVLIIDRVLKDSLAVQVESDPPPLFLTFCLSGRSSGTHREVEGDLGSEPNKCDTCYDPASEVVIHEPAGERLHHVVIKVLPSSLPRFLHGGLDGMPADFRDILEGTRRSVYYRSGMMEPAMHITLRQLVHCPYQGSMKRIYVESKVMELMVQFLTRFVLIQGNTGKQPSLQSRHLEKIYETESILLQNMERPPSILELARRVGLCSTYLKSGFRQVFGMSVFRYLQKLRLEKARMLLQAEGRGVSEAAWEVGYASLSAFHRAFIREYGVNPSSVRQAGLFGRGR